MSVHPDRVTVRNQQPINPDGAYVLYWMSASQRVTDNHALAYAVAEANRIGVPVLVCFGYTDSYPQANARHLRFMAEGLVGLSKALASSNIGFVVGIGSPPGIALRLAASSALVVCDTGYLRLDRQWRTQVAGGSDVRVVEVESNVVVPVKVASDKQEYAARTIRPKITRHIDTYLDGTPDPQPDVPFDGAATSSIPGDWTSAADVLRSLDDSTGAETSDRFAGGESEALHRLDEFISTNLTGYSSHRNEPSEPTTSHLSPYLHFGHISPVTIANTVTEHADSPDADAFVEQLVVRRELAMNYTTHQPAYDSYEAIPRWARATLDAHADDPRPYLVDEATMEAAQTHDRYWNAAMTEMTTTGYMHNYMRMYWGKKILEWSPTPRQGFETTLRLNNKYFIDGRDPVSYASVAWLYGLHDRPWPEREIYGTVRSMTAGGLKRKFDIDAYVARTMVLG